MLAQWNAAYWAFSQRNLEIAVPHLYPKVYANMHRLKKRKKNPPKMNA